MCIRDRVYCNGIRKAFGEVPIVIGGVEASLRRFAHYDYWDNRIRRSILVDSGADLLVYGMGEAQIVAIARALEAGRRASEIRDVPGTCFMAREEELPLSLIHISQKLYTARCTVKSITVSTCG